jgi:hypothetical protein
VSIEDHTKRVERALASASEGMPAPWEATGESPSQYMERLTLKARQALEVLKTGEGDALLAREVLADTMQLATYASARKEIESARAVIKAIIAKETQHGSLTTKRSDARD